MLVNPISFRLSASIFWNSTWSLYKNNNYKYLFYSDLVFFEFLMFFFKKTLGKGSFFDYYSSHIRLYRIQDKIIINLYYHIAKDNYYFDDIDLMYKGFQKKVFIKKDILKINKNMFNIINNKKKKKIKFNLIIHKLIKFIDKKLIQIIYYNLIDGKINNQNLKIILQKKLDLQWNKINKNMFNIVNNKKIIKDITNILLLKSIMYKYFLIMGTNYINFFIKNLFLIKKFKKENKNKKFIFLLKNYNKNLEKLINLKFLKIKKKNSKNFLFPIKKKRKNKIYINKFLQKKSILNQIINKNIKKNKIYNNINIFVKQKKIINIKKTKILLKDIKILQKNELKLVNKIKTKIKTKIKKRKKKKINNIIFNKKTKFNKFSKIENLILKIKNTFYKLKSFQKINKLKNKIKKRKKNIKKEYKKKKKINKQLNKPFISINIKKKINKFLEFNSYLLKKKKNTHKQILKNLFYIKQNKFVYVSKKKKKLNLKKTNFKKDLLFLYKINFLKFVYNQKLWLYNLYYYYLNKMLIKQSKLNFIKFLNKLELNIFKISSQSIRSSIISKFINSSFKHNYNIYETMRPVLVDLKQRMKNKKIAGFKITISGRFKRAQRATYWWRKDGHILTGTQTASIDYNTSLHKTKYGVCTISVWLTPGLKGLGEFIYEYPTVSPFYFILKWNKLLKINYFLLKRNDLFFINLLKKGQVLSYNLDKNYVKGLIIYLLYKYIYVNMFLKNILLNIKKNNIKKNIKKIFLPQYCIYKIDLEDYLKKNYIKIIPFIQIKLLKRLNLRNSYKINFLNKSKLINLNIFKYRISLY